jgi:hypothetical protein
LNPPAGVVEKTMELRKILIVEDSHPTREYLTELVQILGFQAHAVMQKADFLPDFNRHNPDVLLLGSCHSPGQSKNVSPPFTSVKILTKWSLTIYPPETIFAASQGASTPTI